MKKTLLICSTIFTILALAQETDCSSLKTELEKSKEQITELSNQVNYYKETLNLLKPISIAKTDGLEFNITKAVGSKKDKTITITFIYKNIDMEIRKSFQCFQSYFTNPQGEQYQNYTVVVGANKGIRVENIHPDIPTKGEVAFKVDESPFPIIRILTIEFTSRNSIKSGLKQTANFENIPVIWE